MTVLNSTPRVDGFRMPAEFDPHAGCWMLWPHRASNWRDSAAPAQDAFVEVALAIATSERVFIGASAPHFGEARARLPGHIEVVELPSDDAWMRDVGPTFVVNQSGERRAVCWKFNAWGGLYQDWSSDELVARRVAQQMGVEIYEAPLILEGGSFHVDGVGTLITTEECLLNPNRNASLNRRDMEELLRDFLGIKTAIWLPRGIEGDETNGHIDNLCCFSNVGEVVLAWTDDESDPNHNICREAYGVLSNARDARGRGLTIHKLPLPPVLLRTADESVSTGDAGRMSRAEGERLAASYVNFYIGNNCVVVPQFGVATDATAMRVVQSCFPKRRVIGIRSREILLGGGNIHCITQQVPRGF